MAIVVRTTYQAKRNHAIFPAIQGGAASVRPASAATAGIGFGEGLRLRDRPAARQHHRQPLRELAQLALVGDILPLGY
jgi:hypothetical protein